MEAICDRPKNKQNAENVPFVSCKNNAQATFQRIHFKLIRIQLIPQPSYFQTFQLIIHLFITQTASRLLQNHTYTTSPECIPIGNYEKSIFHHPFHSRFYHIIRVSVADFFFLYHWLQRSSYTGTNISCRFCFPRLHFGSGLPRYR